jgi:hypothetical protein
MMQLENMLAIIIVMLAIIACGAVIVMQQPRIEMRPTCGGRSIVAEMRSGAAHHNSPVDSMPAVSMVDQIKMGGHDGPIVATSTPARSDTSLARRRDVPTLLTPAEAAKRFADWMIDHGGRFVGDFESKELLAFYEWQAWELNLVPVSPKLLFEELASLPCIAKRRRWATDASGKRPVFYTISESLASAKPARKPRAATRSKPADVRPTMKAAA